MEHYLPDVKGRSFTKGFTKRGIFLLCALAFMFLSTKFTIATTDYIHPFKRVITKRNNFYATRFHRKKSGKVGESILGNFINLNHYKII